MDDEPGQASQSRSPSISYELTEDDILALCIFNRRDDPWHGSRIGCGVVLCVIAVFTVAIGMLGLAGIGTDGLGIAIFGVIAGVGGVALIAKSAGTRARSARLRAQRLIRSGYGRLALRRYDITILPDRFTSRTELSELHTQWIGIFAIHVNEHETHAFIYTGPSSAVILPARAFEDQQAFVRFVELMVQYRDRAPSLLSTCPACSYDLHGTMIDRCPECGWEPANHPDAGR